MIYVVFGLLALTALLWIASGIWFLVSGFMIGIGWGFAVLILGPLAHVVLLFTHWEQVKNAFLTFVAGLLVLATAMVLFTREAEVSVTDPVALWGATLTAAADVGIELPKEGFGEQPGSEFQAVGEIPEDQPTGVEVFVGRPLEDVVGKFGYPKRKMSAHGETLFMYEKWEFVSRDGKTVAEQSQVKQTKDGVVILRTWK